MSQRNLIVKATELTTIRLICKTKECGATVEVPTERMDRAFVHLECPVCKTVLRSPPADDCFLQLARVLRDIQQIKGIDVEFVLPAPE